MPQDAFTLSHLCLELNHKFKGGKINKIVQYDEDRISFTIYNGKAIEKLNISVKPSCPRIFLGEVNLDVPLTALNFCMLLRKHLQNATIKEITLIDFDRIVKMDFSTGAELFDMGERTLYIELMGRYSNVILTENGKVLGANRGINFLDNGVRPLITGKPYVFPPNNEKFSPKSNEFLSYIIDNQNLSVLNLLSKVQGISNITAKEIEYLYFEKFKDFSAKTFFEFVNEFLFQTKANPCVIKDGDSLVDVLVFPYKTVKGEKIFFDYLYDAENYFFNHKEKAQEYKNLKDRLLSIINSAIKKSKKRLGAITSRKLDASKCEDNKKKADLILTYVYKIKNGDDVAILLDYETGEEIKVELNPNLSPSKNAENYYKKFNKQKRTLLALVPQEQSAKEELEYLTSVLDEINLSETIEELKLIKEELVETGLIKEQTKVNRKKEISKPYREYEIEGFTVKVGRNNKENDQITGLARQGDIWLHTKDYHSSHVIIESAGKQIPLSVIEISAEICTYYSRARDGGKTEVIYTDKKFVKKPKGAKLGFCTYSQYKTLSATPKMHKELIKTS